MRQFVHWLAPSVVKENKIKSELELKKERKNFQVDTGAANWLRPATEEGEPFVSNSRTLLKKKKKETYVKEISSFLLLLKC